MHMVSITEIRRNAKAVLANLIKTKKPIAILQRSKPVAYIIDAESFIKMQQQEISGFAESRKKSLANILQLKERVTKKSGIQEDSVKLIRDLREGINRYE
ncbi:prevent-host-death family protein [Desulfotomaculum arcticum]|uniref:Antitoxin n=1 Tax=Desulfotruncus arcticus DSM 17038 TaxID=1121424 RepID=A0A1I2YQ38_9FIRM|nr:type II toxin-antitoxin system prevent-host-death family antitoxin [Desulfotruncus arcticus]SFH27793.1 prevent-host-death family protein [Desulfotomaculum arcticum] [Desulfotruncus arcticus DSM 17038]